MGRRNLRVLQNTLDVVHFCEERRLRGSRLILTEDVTARVILLLKLDKKLIFASLVIPRSRG
jgi:hypothetical protein